METGPGDREEGSEVNWWEIIILAVLAGAGGRQIFSKINHGRGKGAPLP